MTVQELKKIMTDLFYERKKQKDKIVTFYFNDKGKRIIFENTISGILLNNKYDKRK